ncbi:hypothetical protein GTW25_03685 [Aliihoeflea aestuarii]|jgi:1,4-dihydroxy-2-naphthoyl-CoA synthase|nr:hypothetical protein [Aliihoeflea aestuarii]MCO6390126.1 hypothetical protein [Aliihoeflea aestuarii]
MNWRDIEYENHGQTAVITLNCPEKLNAVRISTLDEIVAALDMAGRHR